MKFIDFDKRVSRISPLVLQRLGRWGRPDTSVTYHAAGPHPCGWSGMHEGEFAEIAEPGK